MPVRKKVEFVSMYSTHKIFIKKYHGRNPVVMGKKSNAEMSMVFQTTPQNHLFFKAVGYHRNGPFQTQFSILSRTAFEWECVSCVTIIIFVKNSQWKNEKLRTKIERSLRTNRACGHFPLNLIPHIRREVVVELQILSANANLHFEIRVVIDQHTGSPSHMNPRKKHRTPSRY